MKLNYCLGIGIVLALVGASLLVAFGFLYLKPYVNVRQFKETYCSTASIYFLGDTMVPCTCASDGSSSCFSVYPCLKVFVNFTLVPSGDEVSNATLYDSYETFVLQANTFQCSYHKCGRVSAENGVAVGYFAEKFVNRRDYRCYYDPGDLGNAILEVVSLSTVVNCTLWPSLALVIGLIIFFVQVFHVDAEKAKQKNQFSSLERQWTRIKERSYGRMESAGSERLVQVEAGGEASHNAVCLLH